MTAFEDAHDATPLTRAALAYHIATGRESLAPHADAVKWALEHADPLCDPRDIRAVEVMRLWLDEVVSDDDTRARLGLDARAFPAWAESRPGVARLHLAEDEIPVAVVMEHGWTAFAEPYVNAAKVGTGTEPGTAGMDAAEAALRRAGVLPEGATVRRAGGGA